MDTLWILQTNQQAFLDDCQKYQVYGVKNPSYGQLSKICEGDTVLLRLRVLQSGSTFRYLGPYQVSTKRPEWVESIEKKHQIWQEISNQVVNCPRWLNQYPWCIFLVPRTNFINELREVTLSHQVKACTPITGPQHTEIVNNLAQNQFLPDSKLNTYRTIRGVWVRSRAEYMIDNWFTERDIVTYYEKAIYIDGCQFIPDWYVPKLNLYVEYLGLKGQHRYDAKWEIKKNMYEKYDMKFIALDENDLTDLDSSIPKKISELKKRLF